MLIPDLYSVKSCTIVDTQTDATIHLNAKHPVFQGHFPNNPVTPGVCMLQIFKELAEKASQSTLRMNQCKNVKFTALINPFLNPDLQLSFNLIQENNRNYKLSGTAHFDDTLALKIQISFSS